MQNLFLFLATLFAFFIKGITGFGNTLVMAPLYSFVVSNRITTPVDLIISIPTNAYMAWRERKNISIKIVLPLGIMLLIGIIPGTFLLKFGQDWMLKSVLGVVLIGLAIEMLTRKSTAQNIIQTTKKSKFVFLILIGTISGMLAGLFGIGALLIAYISRTTYNRNQLRANICCVFLVENLFRLVYYSIIGLFNKEILLFALFVSPAVIIGMMIGIKVDVGLKEQTIKKMTVLVLILSGISLIVKNIFFNEAGDFIHRLMLKDFTQIIKMD